MSNIKELWVDKYRPSSLEDYVLNADLKKYFYDMIRTKVLQNMTFAGVAGSGKTTLAKILAEECKAEVLYVPCATEGTIDVLRTKVSEFCNALSINNNLKIVILDEIDSASNGAENSFQKGLRTLIEAAQDDTRFLLTCNYSGKVIPAVLSRCPIIPLKFDKKDLLVHVKKILDTEKISYTKDSLRSFIEEAFGFYPDCRRIMNYLQFCSSSGELVVKLRSITDAGQDKFLQELVNKTISSSNILEVRQFYMHNKEAVSDYVEFGSKMFNYVIDNEIVSSSDAVLKLSDLLYQLNVVIDKEVGFFAMVAALRKYGAGSLK
nr:MAG TPA: activator clamp loader [Caudoviricetes sp.]